MTPMVTLLICSPAALVFIVCVSGVAVLWPPAVRPAAQSTGGRRRDGRSAA